MSAAPLARRRLPVTSVERLGAYVLVRAADPHGPAPAPGQFAMLATATGWGGGHDERPYLPRAFSIARHAEGECHFLLEDVGPGTRRLCEVQVGEELLALGPLGRGFAPPPSGRRGLLVGGGAGIAPLAILQDALVRAGTPIRALLGFRDAERAGGAALLRDVAVATDDGSIGHHGRVTELLAEELDRDPDATVYACGPPAMLEATRAMCMERDVPGQLALESPMACGFGACYGCVVPRRDGGYVRVCVEGPVLDADAIGSIEEPGGRALVAGTA